MMLYKLEIMDHKAAEKQGTLVSVLGLPIPVVLSRDLAVEVLPIPLCSLHYVRSSLDAGLVMLFFTMVIC